MFLPTFLFWGRRLVLSTDACEMGLIEDNSDRIAHLILDEADLEFSGLTITTANPWKPEQSGNSSGRPGGSRDLVRYVVETTEGGKLLMLWYSSTGVFLPNLPVQESFRPRRNQQTRSSDQAPGHRDVARPWLRQQLDIPHGVSNRPLERICLMGYCGS